MNKNAIKKFAIEARKKLIKSVTDKAGLIGISAESCSEPIVKGSIYEIYRSTAGTEVTLEGVQRDQRRQLVSKIEADGFDAVIEEVAYTWFNRICAIRFMEVNDYLPNRVRVLSSLNKEKLEPDIVTDAPDVELDLTESEKEDIIKWKISGKTEDMDKLYGKLFLKQCHQLHDILPELFEAKSDYKELLFSISYMNKDDVIYMLVNPDTGMPEQDFNVSIPDEEGNLTGQVEIIGWLYQYYNTDLKDDTFAKLKKNIKISKERIPAATQLFTPDWIVRYMVENSVGRIWIEHLRAVDPGTDEKATAERFGWKYYLPEAEQEESVNVKLAEIRTTYKELKPTDITCIDPCMGSGHILIAMFDVLMDIYESVGYDKREAAFEIVEHNIHGLDIDQRAYQLAYFAVMMKGRGYNRRFLKDRDRKPNPKVYAIEEYKEMNRDHFQFFGTHLNETERSLAVIQIEGLLNIFKDAKEYGSILNVDECDWELLEKYVEDLNADGQISIESMGSEDTQKHLRKLVGMARNLGQKYDAVVTNPPYMGASGMGAKLSKYAKDNYPDSKSDLFAVFIEKCGQMIKINGYQAMITQHAWMFLSSFEKLRNKILQNDIVNMAHLGARAFEEIGGEVVQTTSFVIRKSRIEKYKGAYCRLIEPTTQQGKEQMFLTVENRHYALQENFSKIPGRPVAYWVSDVFYDIFTLDNIEKHFDVKAGICTGKNEDFIFYWHEVDYTKSSLVSPEYLYTPHNKGGEYRKWYGNRELFLKYNKNALLEMENNPGFRHDGKEYYFKEHIGWSKITSSKSSFRYFENGYTFDSAGLGLFSDSANIMSTLALLNSKVVEYLILILNPTMNVTPMIVKKLPYLDMDLNFIVKECIRISKLEWDSFETSWDFKKHPLVQYASFSIQEMINDARRKIKDQNYIRDAYTTWSNECVSRFNQLKMNEEELNRIFINIYGLQEELTPEVNDKDVTIRKADLSRDIRSFVSYAVGCMFGRYSLDEEGLILAGQKFESHFYAATAPMCGTGMTGALGFSVPTGEYYYKTADGVQKCSFSPDGDNCIPITDEEYFPDDIVARFVEFVKTVYGADTLEENLDFIANALGNKGDTSREVIRNYFLKDFYADHLKVYQKRPIYWLFDSGKQNGFKALIYMHRYDTDTVGRVRTDYLHRAQKYVETAMQSAQYTIDNASSASEKSKATKAVTKYTKQLAEMKIYDEAIAHIANKRIEIDLDDGVKVNYAKFQGVEIAQEGKKALKIDLLAQIK